MHDGARAQRVDDGRCSPQRRMWWRASKRGVGLSAFVRPNRVGEGKEGAGGQGEWSLNVNNREGMNRGLDSSHEPFCAVISSIRLSNKTVTGDRPNHHPVGGGMSERYT